MHSNIIKHLEANTILSEKQHGFSKRRECETQLVMVVNDFAKILNNSQQVDTILLDFSKAFDKVNHRKLLMKVEHYGRGKLLMKVEHYGRGKLLMKVEHYGRGKLLMKVEHYDRGKLLDWMKDFLSDRTQQVWRMLQLWNTPPWLGTRLAKETNTYDTKLKWCNVVHRDLWLETDEPQAA